MNQEKLVDTVVKTGRLLIESGAEIYRVEETMVRICKSYPEVEVADSFVTATGIMLSVKIQGQTTTRIIRVRSKDVDLNVIDEINTLSREVCLNPLAVDELVNRLDCIERGKRYSFWTTCFFGALGAGGFAILFNGSVQDIVAAFIIGFLIRFFMEVLKQFKFNSFLINLITAAFAAMMSFLFEGILSQSHSEITIISSIMLLVPGLAITNAIRDTVVGDYLSGLARATEAFVVAIAIAMGCGFMMRIMG